MHQLVNSSSTLTGGFLCVSKKICGTSRLYAEVWKIKIMKKHYVNLSFNCFNAKKVFNLSNIIGLSTGELSSFCVTLCTNVMLSTYYKRNYCVWKMLTEKQITLNYITI